MKRHHQSASAYRNRNSISFAASTALLGALASAGPSVQAADVFPQLPSGATLPTGVTQSGGLAADALMTLNQTAKTTLINWESFSIGVGKEVQFNFEQAGSAAINRVTGTLPSNIAGTLSSVQAGVSGAGTVVLINPNGLVMTSTARINVGSFIGSAFDISQSQQTADEIFSDYFSGKAETLKLSPGAGDASKQTIELQGDATGRAGIAARGGAAEAEQPTGSVILVARKVIQNGDISAGTASVAAAAEEVELHDLSKVGLGEWAVKVKLPAQPSGAADQPSLSMDGTIAAVKTELQSTGGDVFALAMNRGSKVGTPKFAVVNGEVVIRSGGTAKIDGTIETGAAGSPGLALKTQAAKLEIGAEGRVAITGELAVNSVADGTAAEATLGRIEAGSVTISPDVSVVQNGAIKSTGDQVYGGKFQVNGAQEVTSTAGNVAFNGTVDGTTANTDALTVSAADGSGSVAFREDVGSGTALKALTSKGTTLSRAENITAETQDYQGTLVVAVGDKVLADGKAHLNGNVTLGGDVISRRVNANGNVVLVGDPQDIEGGDSLVISKNATLGVAQEDVISGSGLTSLEVQGTTLLKAGSMQVANQVYGGDLIVAGGNKTLQGNVSAQGNVLSRRINANGNVVLNGDPEDIDGGDKLTITKNATLGSTRDNTISGFAAVEVGKEATINAGLIKVGTLSAVKQTINNDLKVAGGSTTFKGDVITKGSLSGATAADKLKIDGNATIGDGVGADDVSNLAKFEVTQKVTLKAASVGAADQVYGGDLTLEGGAKTLSGSVATKGALTGAAATDSVKVDGDLVIGDGAGNDDVSNLAKLEVTQKTRINADSVTAAEQVYGGNVTVAGGAKTLTGTVSTKGALRGNAATDSLKIDGDAAIGDGVGADDVSNLAKLEVTKNTTLKAGSVIATEQVYGGDLTVAGGDKVLDGTVTANGNVLSRRVNANGDVVLVGASEDIEGNDKLTITKNATLGAKQADQISGFAGVEVGLEATVNAGLIKVGSLSAVKQTYNNDLKVAGGTTTLKGEVVTKGALAGATATDKLKIEGDVTIGDGTGVDDVSSLAKLEVTKTTTLKAGSVIATEQVYGGDLRVAGGDKVLDGNVTANGNVLSRRVNANGNVVLEGAPEDIEGGDKLTITKNATLGANEADEISGFAGVEVGQEATVNAGLIKVGSLSAVKQTYNNDLKVAGGTTTLKGEVVTKGALAGATATDKLKIDGDVTIGDGTAADDVSNLAKLEVTKKTTLNAEKVTVAEQTYGDELKVAGGAKTLTGAVSTKGTLVGTAATDSLKIDGDATLGDGVGVDDVSNLAKLEVTQKTILNASKVSAQSQQFGDQLTVGGAGDTTAHTLTGRDITLAAVVGSGNNDLEVVTGAEVAKLNGTAGNFKTLGFSVTDPGAGLKIDSSKLGAAAKYAFAANAGDLSFNGDFNKAGSILSLRGVTSLTSAGAGAGVKAGTLMFEIPDPATITQQRFVLGANLSFAKYDLSVPAAPAGNLGHLNTFFGDFSSDAAVSSQVIGELVPLLKAQVEAGGYYSQFTVVGFGGYSETALGRQLPTDAVARGVSYAASIRPQVSLVGVTITATPLETIQLDGYRANARSFDVLR